LTRPARQRAGVILGMSQLATREKSRMKAARLLIAGGALLAAFYGATGVAFADKNIAKKEKKGCVTCHVKMNEKELNDVGKYYKEKKTLEGAPAPKK
jgi:hypothetical protein